MGKTAAHQPAQNFLLNLVRAAAHLKSDAPFPDLFGNEIGDAAAPIARTPAGGEKIVVLKQEQRHAAPLVQVDHFGDDGIRPA